MNKLRHAFTLIELLVVIVIIGILATILVPVVGRAIESGRRKYCGNNLKGLATSAQAFANDNDQWYPWGKSHPRDNLANQGSLADVAQNMAGGGYQVEGNVWICPSDRNDSGGTPRVVPVVTNTFDSTINASYLYIVGVNGSSVFPPSRMLLFADETDQKENGTRPPQLPEAQDGDNHGKKFRNVSFVDGHVIGLEVGDLKVVVTNVAPSTDAIWNSVITVD